MCADTITFCSSDARELYKADVYRALALPKDYVLHFRYPREFIDSGLLTNLSSLLKQKGTIFYVSGNDTSKPEDQRQLTLSSIRDVIVLDIMDDHNIETIHFYLQLKNFADSTPHPKTDKRHLPPYAFVSRISVEDGPNSRWVDRVNRVREDFGTRPFFLIDQITDNSQELAPVYSMATKSSSYNLNDESTYQVRITCYDALLGNTGLTVDNASADVSLAIPLGHRIGAELDTQVFNLFTHSLQTQRLSAVTRILGVNETSDKFDQHAADYRVELGWQVTKGFTRVWQFGLLSILAAVGLSLGKLATDDLTKHTFVAANWILGLVAVVLIGLAAALLYDVFNKK